MDFSRHRATFLHHAAKLHLRRCNLIVPSCGTQGSRFPRRLPILSSSYERTSECYRMIIRDLISVVVDFAILPIAARLADKRRRMFRIIVRGSARVLSAWGPIIPLKRDTNSRAAAAVAGVFHFLSRSFCPREPRGRKVTHACKISSRSAPRCPPLWPRL